MAALCLPPDTDVLCGTELPGLGRGPALARLRLKPALRCSGPMACSPCLEVRLRLALPPGTGERRRPAPSGIPGAEDSDEGGRWSPMDGAASSQPNVTGLLLLSGHTYASSRCVAVEVWAPLALDLPGRSLVRRCGVPGMSVPTAHSPLALRCVGMWVLAPAHLCGNSGPVPCAPGRWVLGGAGASPQRGGGFPAQGWVTFRCFEAPLGSELHVTAYINSHGPRRLSQWQRVPGESPACPAAAATVPPCLLTPCPRRLLVARGTGCCPPVPR